MAHEFPVPFHPVPLRGGRTGALDPEDHRPGTGPQCRGEQERVLAMLEGGDRLMARLELLPLTEDVEHVLALPDTPGSDNLGIGCGDRLVALPEGREVLGREGGDTLGGALVYPNLLSGLSPSSYPGRKSRPQETAGVG